MDNDHLASKVNLRVEAITRRGKPRQVRVLDAYHGHGRLWDAVQDALPDGWEVRILGSDTESRGTGTLKVNNFRLLKALDLTTFDLIDLDAYGWPAAQLKVVAQRAPDVPVVTTRIALALGRIPKLILDDLGYNFAAAPPTLINRLAGELWEAWLYHLGYRTSRLVEFPMTGPQARGTKRYEILSRK